MIARIQYRTHFNRVIGYAVKKGKQAELIASTLTARDTQGMIEEMQAMASRNNRCKKPVAHFVLSVKEGERLSDSQWAEAAQRTADHFGMEQYICIRHADTDCDHIHLIGNRVKANGKTWSTSNDRFRMRTLCQQMEEDFHLTRTASRSQRSRINKDELEKAERLFKQGRQSTIVPARLRLAEEVKATLAVSSSPKDFEERLKRKKISTRWRYSKEGRPIGVSFAREEVSISGRNAGISCKAMMIHFNEGVYEQNRHLTHPGGAARMVGTTGRGTGLQVEGGLAEAVSSHAGAGRTDSPVSGDSTRHRRGDSAAAGLLTETAQASGQALFGLLDLLIRELEHTAADFSPAPALLRRKKRKRPLSIPHIPRL